MKSCVIFFVIVLASTSAALEGDVGASPRANEAELSPKSIKSPPAVDPDIILQGGDNIGSATPISSLPYANSGTTVGYTNDYDETCPYNSPGSPDVVYSFTPSGNQIVNISLCGNSSYDTKLYVYENSVGNLVGCSDDECSTPSYPDPYVSRIDTLGLFAGNIYYIIVDGYSGDAGNYTIDIDYSFPCEYILGDINDDGDAKPFSDVIYAINYFKGGPAPPGECGSCAGDVNGNGIFNGIDVTYLWSYWIGNQDSLVPGPGCPPPLPDPVLPPSGVDAGIPDTIIVGNLDLTPIAAFMGDTVEVPIWVKNDELVAGINMPIAADNAFITQWLPDTFFTPLSEWDAHLFTIPEPDRQLPGYTTQSILGWADMSGPANPFLNTNGNYSQVATMKFVAIIDTAVAGDTTQLLPGDIERLGVTAFSDSSGLVEWAPNVVGGLVVIEEGYVLGDLNSDGDATAITDVIYGFNYFKYPPLPINECAADVNGNGQFNGIDMTYLVGYWRGINDSLLYGPGCPTPLPDPQLPPSGEDFQMPDTIIIGNLDLTPMVAEPGDTVEMPVWVKNDEHVPALNIALAADDGFISQWLGGTLQFPLSDWDDCGFTEPNPDQNLPGYTTQSVQGYSDTYGEPNPNLNTDGEYLQVATVKFIVSENIALTEDTIQIVPGTNERAGGTAFSDTLGENEWPPVMGGGFLLVIIIGPCDYVIGDINGNGVGNQVDITYAISYFRDGGPTPIDSCDCTPDVPSYPFYAAGDVNGNCQFFGNDITYFVNYYHGLNDGLLYCDDCPPNLLARHRGRQAIEKVE
jgi:hypothetical protein